MQGHIKIPSFQPVILEDNTKKPFVLIEGKKWYYRLVHKEGGGLALSNNMPGSHRHILCYTPEYLPGSNQPFKNSKGKEGKIFSSFEDEIEVMKYVNKFPIEKRSFYEVIIGNHSQKPHFDIDISKDNMEKLYPTEDIIGISEYVKDLVIGSCLVVFADMGVKLAINDILLFTSHGPNKRSFHLVINNWCHRDNKEAKAFYDAVVTKFKGFSKGKYDMFVDSAVYSSKQQFRLLGSQKTNSGRVKTFCEKFSYNGMTFEHTYPEGEDSGQMKEKAKLYESLVSFTSGCNFLPSLIVEKPKKIYTGNVRDIDDNTIDRCMEFIKGMPFSFVESVDNKIILSRDAPSYCNVCSKTHDNENPFMFILNDGMVYLNCRRAKTQGIKDSTLVGFVNKNVAKKDEEEEGHEEFSGFDCVGIPSTNNVNIAINSSSIGCPTDSDTTYERREHPSSAQDISLSDPDNNILNGSKNYYDPYDEDFYFLQFVRLARKYSNVIFESFDDVMNFLAQHLVKVVRIVTSGKVKFFWKNSDEDLFSMGNFIGNPLPADLFLKYKTGEEDAQGNPKIKKYNVNAALKNKLDFLYSNKVVSVPYHKDQPFIQGDVFNIFPGFKAKLVDDFENIDYSELTPVLDHIKYVNCDGNEKLYWWLMTWFAHPIRTGVRTDKVPVLIGNQGCGKTIIFEFFVRYVYGIRCAYSSAGLTDILDKFNHDSANKMFVYIDDGKSTEGSGYRTKEFDKLKSIVTSDFVKIESKGVNRVLVQNNCNYCFTSNHLDPVKLENGDRRYCVFMCNNSKIGDWKYFGVLSRLIGTKQLDKTIPNKIGDLMYSYLRSNKIAPYLVNLEDVPMTEIKQDIIEMNLPIVDKFTNALINKEEVLPSKIIYIRGEPPLPFVGSEDLREAHVDAMKIQDKKYSMGASKFAVHIKHNWGKDVKAGRPSIDNVQTRGYFLLEPLWDKILIKVDVTINNNNGIHTIEKPVNMTLRQWLHSQNSRLFPLSQ